jgi:large subunit ribosomal protein L32
VLRASNLIVNIGFTTLNRLEFPMPVPKRKRSRARRDKRFANKGIKVKSCTECSNCKSPLACHAACSTCGFYKGAKVLKTKTDRAVKRGEERQTLAKKRQSRKDAQQKAAEVASQEQETK